MNDAKISPISLSRLDIIYIIFESIMKEYGLRKHNPFKEILMRAFLQVLPTAAVVLYLIFIASAQEVLFASRYLGLASFFALGMLGALAVYQSRLRFVPSFLALLLLGTMVYWMLRSSAGQELEPFFQAHRFQLYFVAFLLGWFVSFGLIRLRFFPIFFAVITAFLAGWLHLQLPDDALSRLVVFFIPIVLFGLYIVYISEQLRDYHIYGSKGAMPMLLNALIFLGISLVSAAGFLFFFKNEIESSVNQITQGKYNDKNSMLARTEDGARIRRSSSLSNSNNRENELLLAVYINNFFEESEVPNPLYLTAFYYNHFDTVTETFTAREDRPDKDLIQVDLSRIPLYHTFTDSSVLEFSGKNSTQKTVEIEVYNKAMRFSEFVAPTTAFSVQPIAVDPEFQGEYKSAYIAQSVVSNFNSAYFVYNANNPQARAFQEVRHKALRSVEDFSQMDSAAYRKYTQLPDAESLNEVRLLAAQIAGQQALPIDQIIAIRDYFLSKDENGKPLFTYTDNPGIPDIPSARSLNYFLFKNRQGFCAHYAGATLFMLRSLGIPSRIAAGFLVEDRSTANPGWYYLYADQVHAWVQVYFPGFGWLDFDTTVGNDEARESDRPDATPPLQPRKANMTLSGVITAADASSSTLTLATYAGVLAQQSFSSSETLPSILDLSTARIVSDSTGFTFDRLKVGDSVTAIVFQGSEEERKMRKVNGLKELIRQADSPIVVDLVQVLPKKSVETLDSAEIAKPRTGLRKTLMYSFFIAVLLGVLVQLFPRFLDVFYRWKGRSSNPQKAAYYNYLRIFYHTWMLRFHKYSSETWQHFAARADARLHTRLQDFMRIYQKLKYSKQPLSPEEQAFATTYAEDFVKKIKAYVPLKKRRKYWLHVKNAIRYTIGRKELR